MIQKGMHVCVGLSGGADSVCLFRILERLRHEMGFSMSAVHVEHGIRGAESLADMAFVKALASSFGITVGCYAYPVERLAKEQGLSVEEAGRQARREAFAKEAALYGKESRIALAHHADDQAETVLFHICRGSGIDGAAGIRPVRGKMIRPLLCVTREEIEAYLNAMGQAYRTDATNADISYSRNRIRRCVMPELARVNAQTVWHMNRFAEEAAELCAYMQEETERILNAHRSVSRDGEVRFALAGLALCAPVLKSRVMLQLIAEASGSRKDIARGHTMDLLSLAEGRTGRKIDLPYGLTAEKTHDALLFYKKSDQEEAFLREVALDASGEPLAVPGGKMRWRVFEWQKKDAEIPQKLYTKWFDYDKIKNRLHLRNRKPGDYFALDAGGGRQKLKDYWINEKVPQSKRSRILLLADGSHILWAVGGRISAYYKVTEQTKRVLEMQYMEEES